MSKACIVELLIRISSTIPNHTGIPNFRIPYWNTEYLSQFSKPYSHSLRFRNLVHMSPRIRNQNRLYLHEFGADCLLTHHPRVNSKPIWNSRYFITIFEEICESKPLSDRMGINDEKNVIRKIYKIRHLRHYSNSKYDTIATAHMTL